MSVEKTTKVAAKKRGRPVTKTSTKREEFMKKAEEVTEKKYSEFDLHNAKKEAFEAGFEAGEQLNDIMETVSGDLTKWTKRQAVKSVFMDILFVLVSLAILVLVFTSVHDWAMNLS